MSALLLSLHVVAAIVAIGPICVAASMFPAEARRALDGEEGGDASALMTGSAMGVLTEAWVIVSIVLTLAAFVVLATCCG
jgi:hypothetical protein